MPSSSHSPFDIFDAIYCINLDRRPDRWEEVKEEFKKVGILERVTRFSAIETPENGAIGCLLSHRAIIQHAKNMNWRNVLVFEDDIKFIRTLDAIHIFLEEAKRYPYDILYFGGVLNIWKGYSWGKIGKNLLQIRETWCTFAICYTERFYNIFLSDYPDGTIEGVKKSLIFRKYKSIDDRLRYHQEKVFCIGPKKIICISDAKKSDIQKNPIGKYRILLYWKIPQIKYIYILYVFIITIYHSIRSQIMRYL